MKTYTMVSLLIIALIIVVPASGQDYQSFLEYWKKGNNGQKLTSGEFKTLVNEVEKSMSAFRVKFTNLSIEKANMTYTTGKTWEVNHKVTCEQFGDAFKFLEEVKDYPNYLTPSYYLYVILNMFNETSADFANVDSFKKQMADTDVALRMWTRAFQKAHLNRLVEAKDVGVELYKIK